MSRRSLLLCALLAFAAALFAAIWSSGDGGGTTPDAGEHSDPSPGGDPEQSSPSDIDPEDETAEDGRGGDPAPGDGAQSVSTSLLGDVHLSGVVRDELGTPWSSFRLRVRPVRTPQRSTDGRLPIDRSFDGADGRYAVPELASGLWRVSAESGSTSSEVVQIELASGNAVIDLVVPRPARIAGRVQDPSGHPAGQAELCIIDGEDYSRRRPDLPREVRADADGRFALSDLPLGIFTIEAGLAGFAPSDRVEMELAAGAEIADLVIVLRPAARILGLALDDAGAPDAGREVLIFGPLGACGTGDYVSTTDANGRFEFHDLPPGAFDLHREPHKEEAERAASSLEHQRLVARLKAGTQVVLEEGRTIEVVLGGVASPGVRVWGFVNGAQEIGRPLLIEARRIGAGRSPAAFVRTGAEGAYEILVDAGEYSIEVLADGGTLFQERVVVADVAELRRDFDLGTAVIGGRVFDALGDPVEAARVELAAVPPVSSEELESEPVRAPTRWARTDTDGAFSFAGVPAGQYTLSAAAPRGRPGAIDAATRLDGLELKARQRVIDIELRLVPSGAIDVLVQGPSGPLERKIVEVVDANGRPADVSRPMFTDLLGQTRVEGLAPGTWFVRAFDNRLACAWTGPIDVQAGAAAHARVELRLGAKVRVSVRGASVPGAEIVVRDARGFMVARAFARASAPDAAKGAIGVVGPLPFGRFTLHAADGDGHAAELEIVVESAQGYDLDLELDGG